MTGKRVIIKPRAGSATDSGETGAFTAEAVEAVPFPEAEAIQAHDSAHAAGAISAGHATLPDEHRDRRARLAGSWGIVVLSGTCGALAGAAVIGIALLQGPQWLIPADPRLDAFERRIATVESENATHAGALDRLASDMAIVMDEGEAISTAIAEQKSDTGRLRDAITALGQQAPHSEEDRMPLMAVAVAQLRQAFAAGLPFEAELVNVYNLARSDNELVPQLTALLGPSRTGVISAPQLRRQLHQLVEQSAELRIGQPQSYYDYGLSLVNEYIGLTPVPYVVEHANQALTEADARLARGDVAGAIAALKEVDPAIRARLSPFLENAGTHERVRLALAELNGVAVRQLQNLAARKTAE